MKKFAKWIIGGVLATSFLTISSLASFQDINTKEVEGYTASSLPTTIDLNDTTEANIRSYYSSLSSLATNQRQGTNLLKNLKTILKNGQKYYSYDSGNAIWQMYEITDRDWTKSPASSTTYGTYNSSTNKITGYTYGTSSSSSKNNPYIHALYINRDVTNQTTAWDNHNQDQWGINREHVWPKAEGFDTSGAGGARGDPMHLMAGNGYANNIHSNYYYGYVKTSSAYTDCGTKYSNQSGNLKGTSKTLNTGTVFEPQDSDKGDIARAIFYMVARYNYLSGSDSDGIDSNNPNLTLTQNISDWASDGYSSTTSKIGKMGILTDLLNWHHQDPVDAYEIHRNNLLYTNYTNNRNPFIDFPEWVDYIWGTATYNGTTYSSYSSTPTGYASPSSDTINGYNSGSSDPVSVTGVSLNKESTEIVVDSSEQLTAIVSPSNATNKAVTWTSSNTNIATVSSSGRVTGVAEGTATITATTSDGGFTDTCSVTIVEASSSTEGTKEGSVTASNGAFSGWTASGTGSKYADGSIKFDNSGDNVYKTSIFSGAISSGMTSLSVTLSGKMNLKQGYSSVGSNSTYKIEALDANGNVLAQTTKTGSDVFVTGDYKNATFTIDSNLNGCTGIKIIYATQDGANWALASASWVATYSSESEVTLSSIAVKTPPSRTTYTAGDGFVASGLVITATYSDNSTADISYDDDEDSFEFDPFDNLQTSDTSVTITYGGQTCSQAITVNSTKTLTNISISNYTTTYSLNAAFSFDGVCTATYSDTSSEPVTPTIVTSPNMDVVGVKTITVSYTYGSTTLTQEYTIEVVPTGSFTWDLTIDSYSAASTTQVSWESDFASMVADKNKAGTNANNYLPPTYTSSRFYTKSLLTFTPADSYQINSVVVTATSTNYATNLEGSTWTNATAERDGTSVTITPTDATEAFYASISDTVGATSVVVNYEYLTSATINASVSKTFYVGETISISDIHVEDNYGTEITGFEFDNDGYMFTYADAVSGGASTSKTFVNSIHYYNMDCSLTVNVERQARFDTTKTTDELNRSFTGVTGNSYVSWTNKSAPNSSAVYAGNNAGGNSSIQLRSSTSSGSNVHSGIISTTSGGLIHTVTVDWNSNTADDRTLSIYGKNTSYESPEDLYDKTTQGTLLGTIKKGTSTTLTVSGQYNYIGVRSDSNTLYLNSISFAYGLDDTPLNLANYIMYEDTINQCESKYGYAEDYFEGLTKEQRATFMTSEDYVISTARERFLDWAKHERKSVTYTSGDYIITTRQTLSIFSTTFGNNKNIVPIIIIISMMAIGATTGYFFLRKKKED